MGDTFLNAKNILPAEIFGKVVEVYVEGAINEGGLRKWCLLLKEVRTKLLDEVPSGRHSLVMHDLKENVPTLHQVIFTCFPSSRYFWTARF
jgi:hypothetical protein